MTTLRAAIARTERRSRSASGQNNGWAATRGRGIVMELSETEWKRVSHVIDYICAKNKKVVKHPNEPSQKTDKKEAAVKLEYQQQRLF